MDQDKPRGAEEETEEQTHTPPGGQGTKKSAVTLQRMSWSLGERIHQDLADDPERAWRLENALKQPFGIEAARTAAVVIITAMAYGAKPTEAPRTTISRLKRNGEKRSSRPAKNTAWGRTQRPRKERPFNPAGELAAELAGLISPGARGRALNQAAEAARRICLDLPGNDLAGQVLQKTAVNRKTLAVFHTKPEAAELMAHLAVPPDLDWGDPKTLTAFRIADYACGSGQLLISTYRRIRELCLEAGTDPRPAHRTMMEDNITAFDLLPASVAAAASNLALMEPGEPFTYTRALRLHWGPIPGSGNPGNPRKTGLGSLDMLDPRSFRAHARAPLTHPDTKKSKRRILKLQPGQQDLVIMNPPFSRYVSHEAMDQNFPDPAGRNEPTSREEKAQMKRAMDRTDSIDGGKGGSGMAFHFTAIAKQMVKRGGTMAILLPQGAMDLRTSLGKPARGWEKFKEQLAEEYRDVMVVSIAQYEEMDAAFSQDTHIAEAMVIARRAIAGEKTDGTAAYVNLNRAPRDREDAARTARLVRETLARGVPEGHTERIRAQPEAAGTETAGTETAGTETPGTITRMAILTSIPAPMAGVLDPEVAKDAVLLGKGEIQIGGYRIPARIPMIRIEQLGDRGPTGGEVARVLEKMLVKGEGTFPMLEGHDCKEQRTLATKAETMLRPRSGMEERANRMFNEKGSLLHISDMCRYNSQSTSACITTEPALAGQGWTTVRIPGGERFEKSAGAWMNSTMGLVGHWRMSNHTQHGLGQADRSQVMQISILDLKVLSPTQLGLMQRIYEEMAHTPMLPVNEAWRDPDRAELDRRIIEEVLGLGPEVTQAVRAMRDAWCQEPSVQGRKGARVYRRDEMETLSDRVEASKLARARQQNQTGA